MRRIAILLSLALTAPGLAQMPTPLKPGREEQQPPPALAVVYDPPADTAHPAAMTALVIPSHGSGMNAVFYSAAGAGPHPTLLLLHGFPGNEQNLDLAQAARRAGWNVMTFHYRGSWGSQGSYSFAHCFEDAAVVVAFLRANAAKYGIDTARIAIAGHSLGGNVAARVAADDPKLLGAFLIDPGDFAATRRLIAEPKERAGFLEGEVRGDMPPLAGTSIDAIMDEVDHAGVTMDLVATAPALAGRPLVVVGAKRGIGQFGAALATAATGAGAKQMQAMTWETDHSFSDKRIALADLLVRWLGSLAPGK